MSSENEPKNIRVACKGATALPLSAFKDFQGNLKSLSQNDYTRLRKQIEDLGFSEPISVWQAPEGETFILNGHQRLHTVQKMVEDGFTCPALPVSIIDAGSRLEAKKKLLAFTSQYGQMERQGLYEYVMESEILPQDLLLDYRFPEIDLNSFLQEFFVEIQPEPGCGEDEIPEKVETICKPGDLWQLGDHRLLCGDSTNIQHVEMLMAGEKADCLFTDPPYNIDFVPQRGTHEAIANDNLSPENFASFLRGAMACARIATKDPSYGFIWSGWSTLDQFAPILREFFTIKALPIWVKNNFGIGYYSRPKYEPFFLCLRGEPKRPDVAPADVWNYAKVYETIHSCEKPVGLIENILAAYTDRVIVLDLFLGSGSTLIACEKTGRKCYGIEIDPHYCDVIIARWEKFSKKQAVKETNNGCA